MFSCIINSFFKWKMECLFLSLKRWCVPMRSKGFREQKQLFYFCGTAWMHLRGKKKTKNNSIFSRAFILLQNVGCRILLDIRRLHDINLDQSWSHGNQVAWKKYYITEHNSCIFSDLYLEKSSSSFCFNFILG